MLVNYAATNITRPTWSGIPVLVEQTERFTLRDALVRCDDSETRSDVGFTIRTSNPRQPARQVTIDVLNPPTTLYADVLTTYINGRGRVRAWVIDGAALNIDAEVCVCGVDKGRVSFTFMTTHAIPWPATAPSMASLFDNVPHASMGW